MFLFMYMWWKHSHFFFSEANNRKQNKNSPQRRRKLSRDYLLYSCYFSFYWQVQYLMPWRGEGRGFLYLGKGTGCSRFQGSALKLFVMGSVAIYIQVFSVLLPEEQSSTSHNASRLKARAQSKTCHLGCLGLQFSPRVNSLLDILFFFPLTLPHRPRSAFKITTDLPCGTVRQELHQGTGSGHSRTAEAAWAQGNKGYIS